MKFFNKDFSKFIIDDAMEIRLEKEREKENTTLATSQSRLVIKYGMKVIYLYYSIALISLAFFAYSLVLQQWSGVLLYAALAILWFWIAANNAKMYRQAKASH